MFFVDFFTEYIYYAYKREKPEALLFCPCKLSQIILT